MISLVHSSLTRLLMSDRSLKSKLLRPLHKIETSRRNVQTAQGSADPGASSSVAAAPASSSQAQHAQQAPSKEEEEERRGLVCMVCKEGYASRPKELLAAYCYCMKLRSGEGFGAVPEVWRGSSSTKPDALQVN